MRPAARAGLVAAALVVSALGCGKKGPPLPPLPGSIPRIDDLEVQQVGDEVRARFSLPIRPEATTVDYATIAVELWRRASEPGASEGARTEEPGKVSDFIEGAELVAEAKGEGLFSVLERPSPYLSAPLPGVPAGTALEYALVLRTSLRKRGTLSNVVTAELVQAPPRPVDLVLEARESGVLLSWSVPEPPEAAEGEEPPRLGFEVHRAIDDRPYPAAPRTEQPLSEPRWSDPDVAEGTRYRYVVRTVVDAGGVPVLSPASEEVTVDFRDAFPPAVPSGLRLIPEGGRAVNLLWNPNTERDLAGYGVYRRSGATDWTRLDQGRVRAASFVDRTVEPGGSYEYAVSAYDDARPPNESERCEPRKLRLEAAGAGGP